MGYIIGFVISVLLGIGYFLNIYSLIVLDWAQPISTEVVIRIAGIFLAPIGAILGYF